MIAELAIVDRLSQDKLRTVHGTLLVPSGADDDQLDVPAWIEWGTVTGVPDSDGAVTKLTVSLLPAFSDDMAEEYGIGDDESIRAELNMCSDVIRASQAIAAFINLIDICEVEFIEPHP